MLLPPAVVNYEPDEQDSNLEEAEPDEEKALQAVLEPEKLGKADKLDTRAKDILSLTLNKLTFVKPPQINDYPAPPAIPPQGDPSLSHPKAPMAAHVGVRQSYLALFMNSTCGRFCLFTFNIFCVNVSILGLVNWNAPVYRKDGTSFWLFGLAMFWCLVTYTIPLCAEKSGMSSLETGWKPFLIMYRLSYVMAIPACICQTWGMGTWVAFGNAAGKAGVVKLGELTGQAAEFWNYFELADGFVALNLTKGVVETLSAGVHGVEGHRRKSRFRDAELRINNEPYSDFVDPTETPGRLATFRIAPIFEEWAPCVSRYRISTTCLQQNPVKGWAVSKSESLCSDYRSVGCKPPKPWLEPQYKCSQKQEDGSLGIDGKNYKWPVMGLCGHVTLPPPEGAIDELGALMLYDAWPKIALPSASSLWLDVAPDDCISQPAVCEESWGKWYLAGLIFQILTNLFIVIPAYYDCKVDKKIRQARRYADEQEQKRLKGLAKQPKPKS